MIVVGKKNVEKLKREEQKNKTLGTYLKACEKILGKTSSSAQYIKQHIESNPEGENARLPGNNTSALDFLLKL